MPTLVINVPRRAWNRVQMLADLHGVAMTPDLPLHNHPTRVELTGSSEKLYQVFRKTDPSVRFVEVLPFAERDPEPRGVV